MRQAFLKCVRMGLGNNIVNVCLHPLAFNGILLYLFLFFAFVAELTQIDAAPHIVTMITKIKTERDRDQYREEEKK